MLESGFNVKCFLKKQRLIGALTGFAAVLVAKVK